jgi:hypothetical protein
MCDYDTAPNENDDLPTRIRKAKDFLRDNPDEQQVTAARIYNLHRTTLTSAIHRPHDQHGGQNKILQGPQKQALHLFIRSLLAHGIEPTHQLIYNSICSLKRAQDPNFKAPSKSWFLKWWKANGLHKIKSKPIAIIRLTAQQEEDVKRWFKKYKWTIKERKIKRKNIVNFDEAGFRVGCAKGHYLLVPLDVKEVRSLFLKLVYIILIDLVLCP